MIGNTYNAITLTDVYHPISFHAIMHVLYTLKTLRNNYMLSDSSENVATQAVTVEKLFSATHVAYLSGFDLLLLLIIK